MKPIRLILLATCVLLLNTTYAQTIRRVNNNPGVTGVNVYNTAQAAHDAAVANDILMIEPSSTSYGDLTLTKPLKIYGNGYFLSTNTELKVDQRSSILNQVYFTTGSGGGEINGIECSWISVAGVSDIIIKRCYGPGVQLKNTNSANTSTTSISNILIRNCHLVTSNGGVLAYPSTGYTISNVLIENNILASVGTNDYYSTSATIQAWIVRNNTFYNWVSYTAISNISNSIFENNLITQPNLNGYALAFNNVSTSYNVSYTAHFTVVNGNQNNFDVTSALIGTGTGISDDEKYQIKAGSPLKTAGSGGTEVGAYGGATPYVVSGIPAIPSIINMTNTATGSNSTPLSVTISVKSNN